MIPSAFEPPACAVLFGHRPRTCRRLTGFGFSGAEPWLVELAECAIGPSRWVVKAFGPQATIERTRFVHGLLEHVRSSGVSIVPAVWHAPDVDLPSRWTRASEWAVRDPEGRFWEAVQCMPGVSVANPSPGQVAAAMAVLAGVHEAARSYPAARPRLEASPGMRARIERAASIIARPWRARLASAPGGASARIDRLLRLAVERFEPHGTRALARLASMAAPIVACQAVLRDVHGEHVLFQGMRVGGIIDWHATGIDTVATDLARLVGSWRTSGSSHASWETCLAGYDSVRPLSPEERSIVPLLHHSGVVVAIDHWIGWLVEEGRTFPDWNAVANRLERLVEALPEAIETLLA